MKWISALFCLTIFCCLVSAQSLASIACSKLLAETFGGSVYSVNDRSAFVDKLCLLDSCSQITSTIHGNAHEFFRGMQLSEKTISQIMRGGMDASRTGFGTLYFGKYAATAAHYALLPTGVEPEHDVPLFPVIFRVDVRGLPYKLRDESVLTVPNVLPAQNITGVWILDTRPDGKREFVEATHFFVSEPH